MLPRILIIDADCLYRMILKEALEAAGYEVIEAIREEDGLRLFRQSPCDLVITSACKSKKGGMKRIQELKQEFPALKIITTPGGGY